MNRALDWLLGSEHLSVGMDGVRFAFERAMPLYAWVGIFAACLICGVWAYRGIRGSAVLRLVLLLSRSALIGLLIILFAGPALERSTETTEPDWVMVLLDRSQSLMVADVPGADPRTNQTRDEQLRAAIEGSLPAFTALADGRELRWFGIGEGAYELAVDERGFPVLGSASLRRTKIGSALEQVLDRAAARPLAGMLLISDGRSTDTPDRAVLRPLRNTGAPLHTVPLGSTGRTVDVAVRHVSAPEVAYQDDPIPIEVELFGLGEPEGMSGTVRLTDDLTGELLAEAPAPGVSGVSHVTLLHRPNQNGTQSWRVDFVPDVDDLIEENNNAPVAISIVDRPVRVLYLDGYPRWEQRYLRNLLLRESTVESSNLMLAANRQYIQEGDREVISLPSSPEEWALYDVIILGDIDPRVLTSAQVEQIRLFVAENGGGLVWIGGESETPYSWWSSPLASLLPFSRGAQSIPRIGSAVQVRPTEESRRLGLLQLVEGDDGIGGWPAELSNPAVGWSALHWAQRIDPSLLKPTASILAESVPVTGDEETPLVMTMRYGAGRSIYIATDEIWRWRYGRGEELYERFWVQIIRLLGRERLSQGEGAYQLTVASKSVNVGDALPITLKVIDQSLLEIAPDVVRIRAEAVEALLDAPNAVEIELSSNPDEPGRFTSVWTPPAGGRWRISAADPVLRTSGAQQSAITIEARLPGGELKDPRPDHELLRSLSESTGGEMFAVEDMNSLGEAGVFPSRSVRRVVVERESLWDTPLALMLFLLLAGTEWIGRRILRVM